MQWLYGESLQLYEENDFARAYSTKQKYWNGWIGSF